MEGMRIYSCYFSLNDHPNKFEAEILELEGSIRSAGKEVLITGDFNSKSPQWGETRLDRRGIIVEEMVVRSDLTVANVGQAFTFTRGESGSIIDLTIATAGTARRIADWKVLDEETLSDHRYIEFTVSQREKQGKETGRHNKIKHPSWNTRKLDESKLRLFLEETRLMDELNWVETPETTETLAKTTRSKMIAACDASAPRRKSERCVGNSMHWWNEELSRLRKECLKARRVSTRSKGNKSSEIAWKKVKKAFKKAMKKSQQKSWKDLIAEVEKDTWGLAYKIATRKLVSRQKVPGLDNQQWVREIIRALFPLEGAWARKEWKDVVVHEEDLFTLEELKPAGAKLKTGKAPGPDGIPNEILRKIVEVYPRMLLDTFNACLQEGAFFSDWKKQKLVLLRKGDKPLNETSSYRPICLLESM